MGALVLFHVILSGEGFVACRAQYVFLSGVFLAVAGCVAGGSEGVGAIEAAGVGTGVLLLRRGGFVR